jgi:hypothetical protein
MPGMLTRPRPEVSTFKIAAIPAATAKYNKSVDVVMDTSAPVYAV